MKENTYDQKGATNMDICEKLICHSCEEGKCKNCNSCKGFIPKSKTEPFNAFDYLVGNVVGVCNFTEDVTPLDSIVSLCSMWKIK